MLIELWERLRGYDNWLVVPARVVATTVHTDNSPTASQRLQVQIKWKSFDETERTECFSADQESPLYQLTEGDVLSIRISSKEPPDFYVPGLLYSDVLAVRRAVLTAIVILLLTLAFFLPEIIRLLSKFS